MAGHAVEPLGRQPSQRPFELGKALDPSALADLDAVVHLAWDRALSGGASANRGTGESRDGNVEGSAELIQACAARGIRVVVLSSTSARRPDRSRYGAAKLAVEKVAEENDSMVFRAGLIWGSEPPPIIQTLDRLANLPAILPLPAPAMMLDHNHESHVARMIVAAVDWPSGRRGVRSLASPDFVSSTQVLRALRRQRRLLDVPVPSRLAASSARRLRDSGRVDSPRLDSIALLDTSAEDLDFDPAYPAEWGADAFLKWLRVGDA
jgi:nucleoside-diphosphate-sugar epimerase